MQRISMGCRRCRPRKRGVQRSFSKHGVVSTDLRPKDLIFDNEVAYYSCIRQHSTFALHSYPHVLTHSWGVIQLLHESEYANS
jgi:hypothetical protein